MLWPHFDARCCTLFTMSSLCHGQQSLVQSTATTRQLKIGLAKTGIVSPTYRAVLHWIWTLAKHMKIWKLEESTEALCLRFVAELYTLSGSDVRIYAWDGVSWFSWRFSHLLTSLLVSWCIITLSCHYFWLGTSKKNLSNCECCWAYCVLHRLKDSPSTTLKDCFKEFRYRSRRVLRQNNEKSSLRLGPTAPRNIQFGRVLPNSSLQKAAQRLWNKG